MKIYRDPNILADALEAFRNKNLRIGLSHGVFDLLHPGHIQHFIAARKEVDVLVVSVTADEHVNKGPGRPVFNEEIRMKSIAALEAVDYVTISRAKTAEIIISQIRPALYFKGSDYKDDQLDPTGKISDERRAVEGYGGSVFFTDELTSSSSKLINSFFSPLDSRAKNWIEDFRSKYSFDDVNVYLKKVSEIDIAIVGEIIIDQYTEVEALGKASKDPILAFNLRDTKVYPGGVLAIAKNCSSWVRSVQLYSTICEGDNSVSELMADSLGNIQLNLAVTPFPTITKHRYVDSGSGSKVFETYSFESDLLKIAKNTEMVELLGSLSPSSTVLVADYGHGLLSDQVIIKLLDQSKFIAVNVQSNAGNRGLNSIAKYKCMDFFTANSRELQLEMRSKRLDYDVIVPQLMKKYGSSGAILTLGGDGLLVFNDGEVYSAPALATKVVDKVGAGDSVFAISSLLARVGAPLAIIGFLSNLVAAHEVAHLGHQSSLSLGDLRKQIKSLLG